MNIYDSLHAVSSAITKQSSQFMLGLYQTGNSFGGYGLNFSHKLFHFNVTFDYFLKGIIFASKFLQFQCASLRLTEIKWQYQTAKKKKN